MTYRATLELPGLPRLQADTLHWRVRAKERKYWGGAVGWALRVAGLPEKPLERSRITFTRYSSAPPDDDNLAGSFKACRDGLIGLAIVDDSPKHIEAVYRWERCKPRKGRITIEIEELEC